MPMPPSTMAPEGSACNLNGRDTQQVSPGVVGQQHRLTRSLISVGSSVCRICHTNTAKEPLISPCRMNFLSFYLNGRTRLRVVIIFMNTCRPESLRIWISHPRNRRNIESDLLILTLLTIVTVGLVAVCLLGVRYFVIEGNKIGISKPWTRGAIWFFLTIDQVSPWYRWWKSTVNVRLVVDPQLLHRRPSDESSQDRESHDGSRETTATVRIFSCSRVGNVIFFAFALTNEIFERPSHAHEELDCASEVEIADYFGVREILGLITW
ncbi:hypothetical protein ALC62_02458 [Cyphomyrmex costatus]|uniref:Uncharacterized protein n=1 Tax=Cyphomyrmex costatus TaxID=456900 RepID=A0A195D2K4_9HYME|nr:hypothetical protein ALC62_02458 [Cyphomyrmex costatus]